MLLDEAAGAGRDQHQDGAEHAQSKGAIFDGLRGALAVEADQRR